VSLDALDDLVFDIVHRLRVGRRTIFCPTLSSKRGQSEFVRDAIGVQVEKNRGGWAIMMGGLT
jgi:hypothetical protein